MSNIWTNYAVVKIFNAIVIYLGNFCKKKVWLLSISPTHPGKNPDNPLCSCGVQNLCWYEAGQGNDVPSVPALDDGSGTIPAPGPPHNREPGPAPHTCDLIEGNSVVWDVSPVRKVGPIHGRGSMYRY